MTDLKLEKLLGECRKHLKRLTSAAGKMSVFMPMDGKKYESLTDDEVEHIDQFLFRFAKLQDTLGEKLFKRLLDHLLEPDIRKMSFIDILNRLEQLEVISNKDEWIEVRKIRNDITHQYEDESKEMAESLNAIYQKQKLLLEVFRNIESRYQQTATDYTKPLR